MAWYDEIGSWLGDNAGSLINLGVGLYGANQQQQALGDAAKAATPLPYSTSSMYGNTLFNPATRQLQYQMGSNPFSQMLNVGGVQSLGNAYSAPGSPYGGAAPEIAAAANAMGGDAQAAEAQNRYNLLTQYAQPEENRMYQRMENNLFARGQMGTTGGGEQYRGFYEAQGQSDLARQLAAQDWAQSRGMQRFTTAQQAVGSGQAGQMNNYNIGVGSLGGLNNIFSQLLSQANTGIGAASGTPASVALAQAQASGVPTQAIGAFGNQSGAFDALGRWIGGMFGSGAAPNQPPAGMAPYGGYVPPTYSGPR